MGLPRRPVVAVVGDGSAMYSIQALWSAAHYERRRALRRHGQRRLRDHGRARRRARRARPVARAGRRERRRHGPRPRLPGGARRAPRRARGGARRRRPRARRPPRAAARRGGGRAMMPHDDERDEDHRGRHHRQRGHELRRLRGPAPARAHAGARPPPARFATEVGLTEDEWRSMIAVLTATGDITDERRQEFILWSDALGLSMLVDALANELPPGATESTVLGPFYVPGAPEREYGESIAESRRGPPTWVHGRVLDLDGNPIAGAELDVWQNGDDQLYAVQHPEAPEDHLRGRFHDPRRRLATRSSPSARSRTRSPTTARSGACSTRPAATRGARRTST